MKKNVITLLVILSIGFIGITFGKYEKQLETSNVTIKSEKYEKIAATLVAITDEDNTFNVTVTNSNDYAINYKVIEENDLYNVTYANTTEKYVTVPANSTTTTKVTISGKQDVVYEEMLTDKEGNLYKNINISIYPVEPYGDDAVQIASSQKVYLEKSIKNRIVALAGNITNYEEGNTFTGTSQNDSAQSGLCSIIDPESGNTIYFYRGNVNNNYVSFAGKTWRVLRINSDGSLRLILDGIISSSQYKSSNTPTNNTIENAIQLINWEDSTAYAQLHTWYNNNIAAKYADYVVESDYVFDTSYNSTTSSATSSACYYFGPYLRVGLDANAYQPTFSYTEESLIRDNIGLITADELLYAGAYWGSNNTSYFLYNSSISNDWWTMSPSFWDNSAHYKAGMVVVDANGRMNDWPEGGNTLMASLGLRPVISIRGDIQMTGDGTASNPYKYSD